MTVSGQNLWTVRWLQSIEEVSEGQWDRLAQPLETPLLEWQWLQALEASGSIAPQYGWHPSHLTIWEGESLIAAAPLYIKNHSDGEFIFDHWWAQLAGQYGVPYYPKLVGMSPATPAVGYRLLVAEGLEPRKVIPIMVTAIDQLCKTLKLASCHLNFIDVPWFAAHCANTFMPWQHQSFLWRNAGYGSFDDYLQIFKSTQRRNIRRERRQIEDQGICIRTMTAAEIPSTLAPVMYRYYLRTNEQYGPWAARYLNADFFERIFRTYRHRLLVVAAYRPSDGKIPLALAMLLVKGGHLIGRYWGSAETVKDLHFNMCFYAPIQWAIENKINTFDPGAGSPHKIYRGFEAVANTSLHRFYDPRLKVLFEHLIDEVNRMEQTSIASLNRRLPYARKQP